MMLVRCGSAVHPASRRNRDRGNAPAESLLVGALLMLLLLGVIQFGLVVHVRNTALDAAGAGARYGGLVGSTPDAGGQRTRDLLDAAFGGGLDVEVSVETTVISGRPALAVTVRTPLPVIGLLGPPGLVDVTARALVQELTP